jgi:hypothetical protein
MHTSLGGVTALYVVNPFTLILSKRCHFLKPSPGFYHFFALGEINYAFRRDPRVYHPVMNNVAPHILKENASIENDEVKCAVRVVCLLSLGFSS